MLWRMSLRAQLDSTAGELSEFGMSADTIDGIASTVSLMIWFSNSAIDHRTTRTRTRRGRNTRMVQTDPHITVYVGDHVPLRTTYSGHGHFYVVYGRHGLPRRLSRSSELRYARNRINPEIWDRSNRLLRTVGV